MLELPPSLPQSLSSKLIIRSKYLRNQSGTECLKSCIKGNKNNKLRVDRAYQNYFDLAPNIYIVEIFIIQFRSRQSALSCAAVFLFRL